MTTEIAYCDTSFILEYWQASGTHDDDLFSQLTITNRPSYFNYVKTLLKTENRQENLKPLKKLYENYSITTKLVSSFFALTELFEKHAEWNFKATIAEATNIDRIFNKGKKDIADLITKVFKDKGDDRDNVFAALFPNSFFESLLGIEFMDLENFNLTALDFHSLLSA